MYSNYLDYIDDCIAANEYPRVFLILRGAPASGKSTFIIDNDLSGYTVSSDETRKRLLGIDYDEDGNPVIPQHSQQLVWSTVKQDIESRMAAGDVVVLLDSQATKTRDMNNYRELAQEYGYETWVVDCYSDVDIDTCLVRNENREFRVPDYVITKFFENVWNQPIPDYCNSEISRDEAIELIDSVFAAYNN
jgi:2',3'-cyclic-nucleotide 3'-phosphodiesterase